jgi:dTDP-glucose 4,6-dehydratase
MEHRRKILITGGAGFIGSHVVERFMKFTGHTIAIMDNFTYAADMNFVKNLKSCQIFKGDITNGYFVMDAFKTFRPDDVIHLAAETHVDNSIKEPNIFVTTNILGTHNLLEAFKAYCSGRFHHVSTDEVYGDLYIDEPSFTEKTPYNPRSPYAASKAASDMLVRAYVNTYNIDAVITNCSNNFGIRQHDEKLIPTVIRNLVNRKVIPVYGNGLNIRDWLHVEDHARAIELVLYMGKKGETYNIGGNREMTNLDLIKTICTIYDNEMLSKTEDKKDIILPSFDFLVKFVTDRPGHDRRYSIDCTKIKNELDWMPLNKTPDFIKNLTETVKWYTEKYKNENCIVEKNKHK